MHVSTYLHVRMYKLCVQMICICLGSHDGSCDDIPLV